MARGCRRFVSSLVAAFVAVTDLAGCVPTMTPEAFAPGPDAQADREHQTRRFDGISEAELVRASNGVLQDLGFTVKASRASLGFVTAVKDREAKAPDQKAALMILMILVAAMGGRPPTAGEVHEDQTITALISIRPAPGQGDRSHLVRVTFHRFTRQPLTWDAGILREAELYDAFFELLSKAIFLEAHKL